MPNWFLNIDGETSGPHPSDHVHHWIAHQQLPADTLFWPDGGSAWLSLDQARANLDATPEPEAPPASEPAPGPDTAAPAASPWEAAERPVPEPQGDPIDLSDPAGYPTQPGHTPYTAPYGTAQAIPQPSRGALQAFTSRLADFAGVERITGFSLRELMSLTMRRHTRDEVEQNFATGLPGFTPPLDRVVSDWPKPWMFVRLYLAASALFLGFVALFKVFHNTNLLPGMIMIGSFAVPLAVLVFFFETNTPRNVSLYTVTHAFLTGGLISLAITLLLLQLGGSSNTWAGPMMTAILEEVGKILAVFVIIMRTPGMRYPWILNGMLFGAAVGAGFAAFESAGYAFNTMLDSGRVDPAISVIILRGALAPFGHVIWTALVAGALWRVKRDRMLNPSMLTDLRVVRILLLVIALHAIWDFPLPLPGLFKYGALGMLAWLLVLGMITSGLKQIKATQASAARGGSFLPQATALQPSVPPVGSR